MNSKDVSSVSTTLGDTQVKMTDAQYVAKTSFLHTAPGKVACAPKGVDAIVTKRVGAMLVVNSKLGLSELDVLYDTHPSATVQLRAGDKIYVYTSDLTKAWAKELIEFEGADMILVPDNEIRLIKRK